MDRIEKIFTELRDAMSDIFNYLVFGKYAADKSVEKDERNKRPQKRVNDVTRAIYKHGEKLPRCETCGAFLYSYTTVCNGCGTRVSGSNAEGFLKGE